MQHEGCESQQGGCNPQLGDGADGAEPVFCSPSLGVAGAQTSSSGYATRRTIEHEEKTPTMPTRTMPRP